MKLLKKLLLMPAKAIKFLKNKITGKMNEKMRVKSQFIHFYNHIDMLLPLKIDFKAVYSDENEKIELTYVKSKKSKGEAENEK